VIKYCDLKAALYVMDRTSGSLSIFQQYREFLITLTTLLSLIIAKKGLKKSKLALSTAETQRSFSIGEETLEEISSVNFPIEDNRPTIS
jgi:hypothetical protein